MAIVILEGHPVPWLETSWRRGPRVPCHLGCDRRDTVAEWRAGKAFVCLSCLLASGDPRGWSVPRPALIALAQARDRRAERKAAARAASLGFKKFSGRKASRARVDV